MLERQVGAGVAAPVARLVRGAWWRTFGILLLVNVIAQVLAGILSVPFVVLTFACRTPDR